MRGQVATMPITTTPKIWMNGNLVDWADAKVHVLTHTLHYGTGVFEGITQKCPGPKTRAIAAMYARAVRGQEKKYAHWCELA